jgi:diaminopimelate decarboxylase
MNFFDYREGELCCEEVPLSTIARKVGTPVYVYSQRTLKRHVDVFDGAFADTAHLVCYAVKANSNQTILRRLADWGLGFEAVSGGELFRVLQAGASPDRVIFSGVGKTPDEIRSGLEAGILFFSVESYSELELISRVAAEQKTIAPVLFRTNPDVDPRTHPYISTGLRHHKFGIPLSETRGLYGDARQMPGIDIVGVGCHIGSQITELAPFEEALTSIARLAADLGKDGFGLRYLDFGGGLGIPYADEEPPSPEAYGQAVRRATTGLGLTLVLEPGRVIVGNAGVLLSRVLLKKSQGPKQFAIVDAGMNDLLRPALYGSFHNLMPVRPGRETEVVDVVGPICESSDFIAQDRQMKRLEAGDLLAIMSAGAYGFSLASNYNSRPRPPEVLVDGDSFTVIRRRETYEDLVRLER